MKRFFAFTAGFLAFAVPFAAQAGFEWQAPSKNPAPTYQQAPDIADAYAAPAPDVMSEPLPQYQQPPVPLTPPPQQAPQQLARPAQNLSGGLFIDPYPLKNPAVSGHQAAGLNAVSVEQAMIEEARALNPLPLGAGMKTGAQPIPTKMPQANKSADPYSTYASLSEGLTPMQGGEPAPLPGSVQRASTHYEDAIGFGSDLPLALALSQVIPPHFTHSYANGIDAGTTVSWEGGRPWNDVLSDMLNAQGMSAQIDGNKVTVYPL